MTKFRKDLNAAAKRHNQKDVLNKQITTLMSNAIILKDLAHANVMTKILDCDEAAVTSIAAFQDFLVDITQ